MNKRAGIHTARQTKSALFSAVDFAAILSHIYSMAARRSSIPPKTIQSLRERGYRVKRPEDYVKQGLEVHRAIYAEFTEVRRSKDMRAYEALSEAMSDWIKKHKP